MKKQQRPLGVGDFALTRRSIHPKNNGLRVVVVKHVPGHRIGGRLCQYKIQRVDGQPIPYVGSVPGPYSPAATAWAARSKLDRLDLKFRDPRDTLAIGRDPLEGLFTEKRWADAVLSHALAKAGQP